MASIPLELLAPMVVGGVSLVVVATRLLGGAVPAEIRDDAHARRLYTTDFPTAVTREVVVGDRSRTALVALEPGLGAVTTLGDKLVVRQLDSGGLRAVRVAGEDLVLTLTDFGAPTLRIRLSDPSLRERWLQRATAEVT
ncbi:MAG: hypothetical protein KTR31_05715 [Myxococcales bacterium]|nr:hypothetical protein [Myxococcales bacterium]